MWSIVVAAFISWLSGALHAAKRRAELEELDELFDAATAVSGAAVPEGLRHSLRPYGGAWVERPGGKPAVTFANNDGWHDDYKGTTNPYRKDTK